MKNLMKVFICLVLVLSFNIYALDTTREYRGSDWTLTVNGEEATLTHALCDVEYALTCEPMDCGPFCASCGSDIDNINVDINGIGMNALVYGGSFPVDGIELFHWDYFDPAITVHDNE